MRVLTLLTTLAIVMQIIWIPETDLSICLTMIGFLLGIIVEILKAHDEIIEWLFKTPTKIFVCGIIVGIISLMIGLKVGFTWFWIIGASFIIATSICEIHKKRWPLKTIL